jgi:Mrp family chromosome partitioning ATPase
LRRRGKLEVLAEVPAADSSSSRAGALGREQLRAYTDLAARLAGSSSVFLTGSARSTASVGLAAAATADGRQVALLECDLAEPALAAILGLLAEPGLHEYLRGEVEAGEILQPLVLAGPASGRAVEPLTCIVAGAPEPEPVALLDSERCDKAIERLRRAYDLLLIVGPGLGEDADSLCALAEHAATSIVCGGGGEISKRPPVPLGGAVLVA